MNEQVFTEFKTYIKSIDPLTIGDLRKAIEGLDDSYQILVELPENMRGRYSDFFNVSHNIIRPDVNEDYSALTFTLVDTYDSRQF